MDTCPVEITAKVTTALASINASAAVLGNIVYDSFPQDVTIKNAYVVVEDTVDIVALTRQLNISFIASHARIFHVLPPLPHTNKDVDLSPVEAGTVPNNCRVRCCPHHYQEFTRSEEGYAAAVAHGKCLHGDFYRTLQEEELACIGWHRCVEGCHQLFLGENKLDQHQLLCAISGSKQAAAAPPPAPAILARNDPQNASLFCVCPPAKIQELESLLHDVTIERIYILQTVLDWVATAVAGTELDAHDNT